jgi:hypothetical protein
MLVSSFALEESKATAKTQLTNEETALVWILPNHVLENRIANLILDAVLVLAGLYEKALVDLPWNICDPYASHLRRPSST